MSGRSQTGSADARYKFTGKERDQETGYDYFGARYYDSWLGRWLQVDPLAGKYPGWSPYNYVRDNPLIRIDPNGQYDTRIEFDQNTGNVKNIVDDGRKEITGAFVNSDSKITTTFSFNDEKDAQALINGFNDPNNYNGTKNTDGIPITGIDLKFNQGEMISNVLKGILPVLGSPSIGGLTKLLATANASRRFGTMDYVQTLKKNPNRLKVINNRAYNSFDAGDYMWGMGMSLLGYTYKEAVVGSQLHALVKEHSWDQPEDQQAIYNGFYNR